MQVTKDKVGQTNLTPSTLVFLVKAETHPAVVGHLLAPVDQHVNVVWIVQRLRLAPDDGEGGGDVWRPRRRHVHDGGLDVNVVNAAVTFSFTLTCTSCMCTLTNT